MTYRSSFARPVLADAPLVLVPQYFGSTVFLRERSRYLPFDQEATRLLVRSKDQPFSQIIEQQPEDEDREALFAFFEHFYNLGFFTLDHRFAGEIVDIRPPADHLAGPLAVHLEVTATCNLTCKHCFAGDLPRQENPLSLEELDELFASLSRMGSYRLGLTGGEPLARQDIFEIIDLAHHHGLHPCLTTNALLITEEIAKAFGERDLLWLNVSLDGASAETNDLIRGQGVYHKVMERLKVLAAHTSFTLAFTVMKSNLHEIEACAELAYQVGAASAVFRPLYPVGTALHHLELMPTFQEYNMALNALNALEHSGSPEMCAIDPFSPNLREEVRSSIIDNHGCGAGNTVCSISVSGDVNPCSFLGPAYNAANLRSAPFENIWHNSQGFTAIRNLPGGSEDTFSGGCRVRAQVFNGSANRPDPWMMQRDETLNTARADNVTLFKPTAILRLEREHREQGR